MIRTKHAMETLHMKEKLIETLLYVDLQLWKSGFKFIDNDKDVISFNKLLGHVHKL